MFLLIQRISEGFPCKSITVILMISSRPSTLNSIRSTGRDDLTTMTYRDPLKNSQAGLIVSPFPRLPAPDHK